MPASPPAIWKVWNRPIWNRKGWSGNGCSAGAYGAILHSAYITQRYPDADLSVLADSGAGIITDSFLKNSLPNWNAQASLPDIKALQVPIDQLTLGDLYVALAEKYPNNRYAQTATAYDADQIFFFSAMGGQAADWPTRFRSSLKTLTDRLGNFTSYVPPGSMHCVTPYDILYRREVNGVKLSSWVEQLATGTLPAPVACEGNACCSDPVCDACTGTASDPRYCRFCESWPPTWSSCAPPQP